MDEKLEELKKKKLRELQEQASYEEEIDQHEEQQEEFEKQKKMVLIRILTPKARERLGNIKVARPKVAEQIENQLLMLSQSGRLKNKINDKQLQDLLSRMMPKKREINIRRK